MAYIDLVRVYGDEGVQKKTTYVILTGAPKHYASKKDFLEKHPEYTITGKLSQCHILFTDDLNSNSSKMQRVRAYSKHAIEICEY